MMDLTPYTAAGLQARRKARLAAIHKPCTCPACHEARLDAWDRIRFDREAKLRKAREADQRRENRAIIIAQLVLIGAIFAAACWYA